MDQKGTSVLLAWMSTSFPKLGPFRLLFSRTRFDRPMGHRVSENERQEIVLTIGKQDFQVEKVGTVLLWKRTSGSLRLVCGCCDESEGWRKRLRCDSSDLWDKTRPDQERRRWELAFPRRIGRGHFWG